MRVSTRSSDPGYTADYFRYKVLLDGILLSNYIFADEEAGEALIFLSDAAGDVILDGNKTPIEQLRRGLVRIQKPRRVT